MREALAKALSVSAEKIHLKAKTNGSVDAIGAEKPSRRT